MSTMIRKAGQYGSTALALWLRGGKISPNHPLTICITNGGKQVLVPSRSTGGDQCMKHCVEGCHDSQDLY